VALSVGAKDAENEPPEKLTTMGAPVTRQPSAALNGSMAWIEQDPESRSPAASVIVPVTVVVCATAAHDQRRRTAIRIFEMGSLMSARRFTPLLRVRRALSLD
jgi:hypothetical protein